MTKTLKKRLILIFTIFLVVAIAVIGIFKTNANAADESSNKMYYDLNKIAPYTHEITFNDFRYDDNLDTINNAPAFGCSSVRNGDFYGRNFDYIYNDTPEFVVKMKGSDSRYGSISVCQHWGLRDDELEAGKYDKQLELIPNLALDGINEKGVTANINVVPYDDVTKVEGTNPEGEKLHMLHMVRFVLDKADSADKAVELLKTRNIYGDLHKSHYLHMMVADKDKTYIIEFLDNKLVAQEKTGNEQVMTNFYCNLPEITNHAMGIERYKILQDGYDTVNSVDSMAELMKKASFIHLPELNLSTAWGSDTGYSQSEIKVNTDEEKTLWFDLYLKKYNPFIASESNRKNPDSGVWITVHNTNYDMKNKTLKLYFQQDYNKSYDYQLTEELYKEKPNDILPTLAICALASVLIVSAFAVMKKKK